LMAPPWQRILRRPLPRRTRCSASRTRACQALFPLTRGVEVTGRKALLPAGATHAVIPNRADDEGSLAGRLVPGFARHCPKSVLPVRRCLARVLHCERLPCLCEVPRRLRGLGMTRRGDHAPSRRAFRSH
jgi:hypothetical protein